MKKCTSIPKTIIIPRDHTFLKKKIIRDSKKSLLSRRRKYENERGKERARNKNEKKPIELTVEL